MPSNKSNTGVLRNKLLWVSLSLIIIFQLIMHPYGAAEKQNNKRSPTKTTKSIISLYKYEAPSLLVTTTSFAANKNTKICRSPALLLLKTARNNETNLNVEEFSQYNQKAHSIFMSVQSDKKCNFRGKARC